MNDPTRERNARALEVQRQRYGDLWLADFEAIVKRAHAETTEKTPWWTADDLRKLEIYDAEYIAAASPDVVLSLLSRLAHMREARDAARAEVERLTAKLDAMTADDDKLSIMFGWLVYAVGEHTCGGYGPESGYAHEPGCGFEPVLRLDKLEGWPGEKPFDGEAGSTG